MSTLSYGDCEVGMKVMLTDPDPEYDIGSSNPKAGTIWECDGTITEHGSGSISVDWDNGSHNGYKDNELSPVNGGICLDLWEGI
jgi:hypothetical protein